MVKYVTYKFQTCVCDHHGTKDFKEYIKVCTLPAKYITSNVILDKLKKISSSYKFYTSESFTFLQFIESFYLR